MSNRRHNKSMTNKDLQCKQCNNYFDRCLRDYNFKSTVGHFCSRKCYGLYNQNRFTAPCDKCGVEVTRRLSTKSRTKHVFCTKSCAVSYNNVHKKFGVRRSKLECFLETQIKSIFPTTTMICNGLDLGFELDFYFPTLRLGIELNGVLHYEPIYGEDKFNRIQNNDSQKMISCAAQGIELIVIPTLEKNLTLAVKKTYWSQVETILNNCHNRL